MTVHSMRYSEYTRLEDPPLDKLVPPAIAVAEGTDEKTVRNHNLIESVIPQNTTGTVDPAGKQRSRINPDSPIFIRVVVTGIVIAGLVAFAISFVSLYAVAEWLGLPVWMWWAVPVFIDLAILVYAALVLVHKARGERTWPSWTALGAFTLLSVIANGAHALSHDHDTQWQASIGVLIAAMVPIAIFVATEQFSRVAVEDLNSRKSEMRDQIELEAVAAEQQQAREELAFEAEQRNWQRESQRLQAKRAAELAQRHHEYEMIGIAGSVSPSRNGRHGGPGDSFPETSVSASRSAQTADKDNELVVYLRACVADGHEITGALVAKFLGVSDRTGRRRIQSLQQQYPGLFCHDEVSGDE